MYSYSGYGDGGDALGAIHHFRSIPNPGSKLVLGRWAHGSSFHISPYVQSNSEFNHLQEQMRFFDQYLKGIDTGIKDEPPVHYYTIIEEKWHSANTFPPPTTEFKLYFQAEYGLDKRIPEDREGWDDYQVDYSTGTGERSCWNTLCQEWSAILTLSESDKMVISNGEETIREESGQLLLVMKYGGVISGMQLILCGKASWRTSLMLYGN